MTRSFLTRSAIAAGLLTLGLALTWGKNSIYDKMISTLSVVEISIVLAVLATFWMALALWVVVALKPTKWAQREASHGKAAHVLAVVAAAVLGAQPARAVVLELPIPVKAAQPAQTVQIEQPFALTAEQQRQVDAAVEEASKQAKDAPGFVVTVEAAIGIFIAAVVVGTVLYIIVRMVCSSLDKMKFNIQNRLTKVRHWLEHPGQTNTPAVIGAGLWRGRDATTSDLPIGKELVVGCTVSPEPPLLTAAMATGEKVSLDEFLANFGLTDKLPLESVVGAGVAREGEGFKVAEGGVALSIESCTNLARGVWKSVLSLRVPAGAVLDFADLTGNSENRYWRVGVAP